MRMHAQTAVIENGFVHIPETARDQGDSIEQFLDWFKTPFAGQASTSTTAASTQRPSSVVWVAEQVGASRSSRPAAQGDQAKQHDQPEDLPKTRLQKLDISIRSTFSSFRRRVTARRARQ